MDLLTAFPVALLADASAASNAMKSYITPLLGTMVALAGIAVVFFLVWGGIQYITSSGDPDKLDHAKRIIKNALIGLVLVIAAATLTAILSQAYSNSGATMTEKLPALTTVEPQSESFTEVVVKAVIGLLKHIVVSGAKPFLVALDYFTKATPLMADNSGVFNLWLTLVGIADVLFIVVVALLGFHVMSFATFGLDEIEFKHLLPRLALIFLLINTSIFAIDAVIGLSNAMIRALQAGFPDASVWKSLTDVVDKADGLSLVALLLMVAFLVLTVMLMIYYVFRLVVLYLGAVLAPVVFLIWLLPAFKDFAETAMKVYLTTIFVLFVHIVILQLAASIFTGMTIDAPDQALNPVMSMIVGIATVLVLLKTQGAMSQLSYASLGPKTARKLGGQVTHAISHFASVRSRRDEDRKKRSDSGDDDKNGKSRQNNYSNTSSTPPPSPPKGGYSATTRPTPKYSTPSTKDKPGDEIDYPIAAPQPKPRKAKTTTKTKKESES